MARLATSYGDKPAGFCTILSPNRDISRYAASWELRVIVCIISLSMFTSHIKVNMPKYVLIHFYHIVSKPGLIFLLTVNQPEAHGRVKFEYQTKSKMKTF